MITPTPNSPDHRREELFAGALAGIEVGESGKPPDWLSDLREWPRSRAWIRRLAAALSASDGTRSLPSPGWAWPLQPIRNLFFLGVVLAHGFGRLVPRPAAKIKDTS